MASLWSEDSFIWFVLQIQSSSEAISSAEVTAFALGEWNHCAQMAKGLLLEGKSRNMAAGAVAVLRDRKCEDVSWQTWN